MECTYVSLDSMAYYMQALLVHKVGTWEEVSWYRHRGYLVQSIVSRLHACIVCYCKNQHEINQAQEKIM